MKKALRAIGMLLLVALLPAAGSLAAPETGIVPATPAGTMTDDCTVTMPEGLSDKAYRITDSFVETYQIFKRKAELVVELPETAAGLYLQWYEPTTGYAVRQEDAAGATLSEAAAQPFLNCYYPLDANTRRVVIVMTEETSLSGLRVYGAGETIPEDVQRWSEAPETADLLIVAATPEEVLADFGGVLASYTVEHDVATALAVLSPDTRTDREELLAALWDMGVTAHPVIGEFHCVNNAFYKMVRASWGKKLTKDYLEDLIFAYAPAVVLTHNGAAETAISGAAQFTSEYTVDCAERAGVKKVYTAAPEGTALALDEPLVSAGGATAADVVARAYALCLSRHPYHATIAPASAYALISSLVGADTGGDLLENLDKSAFVSYADPTPTPAPTPEPTATPTLAPTAAQTALSEADTAKIAAPAGGTGAQMQTLLRSGVALGVGLLLTVILFLIAGKRLTRRMGAGQAMLVGLLPFVAGVAVAAVLFVGGKKGAAKVAPVPAETAAAFETPAPEPAETPMAEAEQPVGAGSAEEAPIAETMDPEARADDEYYRQAGDPAEVVVVDAEGGHWEYKTDTLSIRIDREETTYESQSGKTYPLVLFRADIRMRDVNSFRTVQADDARGGAGAAKPWIISRRNKAVLMITGDNLVESDEQYKSILIRDGIVFLDERKCDVMAMYPDGTMRIFGPADTSAKELLMDGVRDAFSFAPTFIRDGVVNTDMGSGRIGRETNPRTGIGMIEPGHFIAIVADGRQPDYSYGMSLPKFEQLFIDAGCTQAYNLDGGVSACMLFMGEQLNRHGDIREGTYEDTYQRRIPDGLVWGYSDQVPDEDDPIYNRGEP